MLYVIAGGLLLTFLVIGRVIFRDARRHVPADARTRARRCARKGRTATPSTPRPAPGPRARRSGPRAAHNR